MRKTVYIAHPLGAGPDRQLNLERAARWVAWAALQGYAPSASWIVLASQWSETPENRAMGLECDIASICSCELGWLCGPRVSPGMLMEATEAYKFAQSFPRPESHVQVYDLTYLGLVEPPESQALSNTLIQGAKLWAP